MRRIYPLIICSLLATIGQAQVMTLQQCITTGIDHNLSLASARISIDKSRTGISQNQARLLPVVNGLFQFTDYLKRPVNVTTGTLLGSDFPDDPKWQTIRSMQYNANAGIQLTVPVYNQTILCAIDVARTMENIASLSYDKTVDDLTLQISKVYYMAQASLEQQRLTEENIQRMEQLCDITEALYGNGVVMEVDLNRVRINLKNLQTLLDQWQTVHSQQLNMLRFLIDIAPECPLEVTAMGDKVDDIAATDVNTNLPELLVAQGQIALAEQQLRAVKSGYVPSIAFTGYAGGIDYQEKFHHFFHTSAATDNWFGNCYIGVSIKIPIFDGNSKKLQMKQHRLDRQQASINMELTQKKLNERNLDAQLQLRHNIEVLSTQSESRRQAEEVYNVTEEQYKEGVQSMTALLQDEMQLRQAQTACVEALCQCRLAQLELLKLSGNLSVLSRQQ